MTCEVKKEKGVNLLSISGRLDASNAKDFENQIIQLVEEGETAFVSDFEKLEYISSAGLRAFLLLEKKLTGNGHIYLCNLNEYVAEVFEISGFLSIFKTFPDLESALAE